MRFTNPKVVGWLEEWTALMQPERSVMVDASAAMREQLIATLVELGTIKALNPQLRPGSYLASSDPRDVARLESRTIICSEREADAGPTNNWRAPSEMREMMRKLYEGCMRGRTMYIIPFSMGEVGSPFAIYGIEITDSAYVALSMLTMATVDDRVRAAIDADGVFVPAVHSVGYPLVGREDVAWPCNPEDTYIAHFPETREIWSYGSGYGGNALLGKKCLALRIASVAARDEGWLAEHMLILKLTSPRNEVYYVAGAFPSACGKTNLAMLVPTRPGWRAETVGDDIAWLRRGPDGRLWAVNPEMGFFGVAPGTSVKTNPVAMETVARNTIFTNCALTADGDVWWEGMTKEPPEGLTDWQGRPYTGEGPAAHPNARFTVSIEESPNIAPERDGVPISAILFGGRRSTLVPLVTEARSWEHGVFLGSIMASETTAAAEGAVGRVRRDPFAMLPFCGYNMGDYFGHWLSMAETDPQALPRIYLVNWFRRGADGGFVWPGYGENVRVLSWIIDRLEGRAAGSETPLGLIPKPEDFEVEGLDLSENWFDQLFSMDKEELIAEVDLIREHYARFAEHLPKQLAAQFNEFEESVHR
ncbi:MAG: phosphoenolpyruvate carboxykinase (GTP) [Ferrimicrobium sp.]|jgi:phosphoenolpyruvate carboxykinase (GTP)|uniref:phosphoenolpyruvate carboxykinase (GTP) n=1 Tax=Ferrimicrobium sp. TaxID=2926050 RepID=UPI002611AC2A|nr:phosphoenolpyruvate carboxykinase (GTP) [Ferrimicrobium sp.]MCL5972805.1 phosphoenolpyruvate carboxykinase (GTP) [Actinomycetota bacterium]